MAGGRPTRLTKETQRAIVEALKAGNFIDTACKIAGVTRPTFYNWIERGKAKEAHFGEFFYACEKAIAESEHSAVRQIRSAGKKNWQALAWWLERRFRARWAKNSDLGIANSTPGQPDSSPSAPERK